MVIFTSLECFSICKCDLQRSYSMMCLQYSSLDIITADELISNCTEFLDVHRNKPDDENENTWYIIKQQAIELVTHNQLELGSQTIQ